MKYFFITMLFIVVANLTYGQIWEYKGVDHNNKLKHEYWLLLKSEKGVIETQHIDQTFIILILDVKDLFGNSLPLCKIIIKNLQSDSIFNTETNLDGVLEISIPTGSYYLQISALGYDEIMLDLDVEMKKKYLIHQFLAPHGVFQVNAKAKLKESEMREINDCIRSNGTECYENERYKVMMHL